MSDPKPSEIDDLLVRAKEHFKLLDLLLIDLMELHESMAKAAGEPDGGRMLLTREQAGELVAEEFSHEEVRDLFPHLFERGEP